LKSIEEQLVLHEGLRLNVYRCPAGYQTIGVGRNLDTVGLSEDEQLRVLGCFGLPPSEVTALLKIRGITKDEAMFLLGNDIEKCYADLEPFDWFQALDPVRQKVILDMRFNLGLKGLLKFRKMIAALKVKDYKEAARQMEDSLWYKQVGNRGKRLVKMMQTGFDY